MNMISNKRLCNQPCNILLAIIAIVLLLISPVHCDDDTEKVKNDTHKLCERLPTSLTYKQDAAPADVSAILRVVVEKINRDVTGVVDVEVCILMFYLKCAHLVFILTCVLFTSTSCVHKYGTF